MSRASMILAELADRNVTIQLDGDTLVPSGPREMFTADVLNELRRHKPEIVAALQRQSLHSSETTHDILAQRIADLADAWRERIAFVLEAGDIGEAEARRIAEAEIGRRFVETFMPGEVAP